MAIIRNTAAMRLKGSVGNTTYYVQGRRQIARVSQNSSNYGESARRSPAQQRRRVMWSNLVNFYKASKDWMKGSFETKKPNETDYNRFMSVNLPMARVALTKDQALQGACVYDSFIVSQGSLPSIGIERRTNKALTSLVCSFTAEQIAGMTLGVFSQHLIEENPTILSNGCQLSFVIYGLEFNGSIPWVRPGVEELCIDIASTTSMADLRITEHIGGQENKLAWTGFGDDEYVAVILSDSTSGALKVSTQSLVPGDVEMTLSYCTEEKVQAAMESYGVDDARFLDSGPYTLV